MKFQLYPPQAIHELGKRKNQEDTIYPRLGEATAGSRIFLVCDGMGGHEKGEVASAAVCKGMSEATERQLAENGTIDDNQFNAALTAAFDTLDGADVEHEGKMGTTMTFICLHKGGCLAAYIGDSRIYHLRPATGEVLYRSRDHSLVQQLYDLGEISYNDMATSPRKNIILKAMQPFQEERVKATLVHITDIRPGDYFYLCSDGMLEEMEDDVLMGVLKAETTDEEKVQKLIGLTVDNSDNHSAYLLHIRDVEHEPGDETLPSDEEEERRKNKALNDQNKDKAWDSKAPQPNVEPKNNVESRVGSQMKRYAAPAILLASLLALGVILLHGGKKGTADEDLDADDTEMLFDEDMEESSSIKSDAAIRQRAPKAMEPDLEPQSLPKVVSPFVADAPNDADSDDSKEKEEGEKRVSR